MGEHWTGKQKKKIYVNCLIVWLKNFYKIEILIGLKLQDMNNAFKLPFFFDLKIWFLSIISFYNPILMAFPLKLTAQLKNGKTFLRPCYFSIMMGNSVTFHSVSKVCNVSIAPVSLLF